MRKLMRQLTSRQLTRVARARPSSLSRLFSHFLTIVACSMSLSEKQEQQGISEASVVESLVPKVKAEADEDEDEEDLIDPAVQIKKDCAEQQCGKYKDRFDACTERVTSRAGKTEETCFEEILDLYHCIDHCAGEKIFKHVK